MQIYKNVAKFSSKLNANISKNLKRLYPIAHWTSNIWL